MSYAIDIPPALLVLMDELPRRTCASVHLMLARIAEAATLWGPEDPRWEQFVQRDGEGLRFYVDGCCVRVCLQPEARRLVVQEIGRVLIHLRVDSPAFEYNFPGSLVEQ